MAGGVACFHDPTITASRAKVLIERICEFIDPDDDRNHQRRVVHVNLLKGINQQPLPCLGRSALAVLLQQPGQADPFTARVSRVRNTPILPTHRRLPRTSDRVRHLESAYEQIRLSGLAALEGRRTSCLRRTPELSDAGGVRLPNRQTAWPARVRSSDLRRDARLGRGFTHLPPLLWLAR